MTNWIFSLKKWILKLIFAGYTGSKNQVWNRIKIQFFEIDFFKLIFQKSSTDQQGIRLPNSLQKSDIIYVRSIGQTVISVTGKNLGQGSNDLLLRITLGIILTLRFLILISSILLNIPRGIILCSAILLLHQLPHLFDALQYNPWSYISPKYDKNWKKALVR